jgi:hypothetical protein
MNTALKFLLVRPISSFAIIVGLVVSAGVSLRIIGPVSIQVHHLEVPDINIRIGNVPAAPTSAPAIQEQKSLKRTPRRQSGKSSTEKTAITQDKAAMSGVR